MRTFSCVSARAIEGYLRGVESGGSAMHLLGTGAIAELEQKLKAHYGMKHALCVSNATNGLLAVALGLDLRDAEFLAPPLGYGATLAGWLLLGNRPRFVDVDPVDLGIDTESAAGRITSATKAILAADVLGVPSNSRRLRRLADDFGLVYVADAAQSLGARRHGAVASGFADVLITSFTVGKTVFAGEGGAILTNNTVLYEKLLWLCQHPERQRRELGLGLWNEFGMNFRPHPLGAVWANAVFEESLRELEKRRHVYHRILDLVNASGVVDPIDLSGHGIEPSFTHVTSSWRTAPEQAKIRDFLASEGVDVRTEPAPIRVFYRQPAFRAQFELQEDPVCPVAEHQERMRFCVISNGGL